METKQKSFNQWEDRQTVKKGSFAENIIKGFLEEKGYVVYMPETRGAHAFDNLAIKNKENIIIAECKAKARRNHYPDTGINLTHYKTYMHIQEKHNLKVFIFFIDEMMSAIYGNYMEKLTVPISVNGKYYPCIEKNIVYFPLKNMVKIKTLTPDEVGFLKEHSTRKHEYAI